MKRNRRNFRTPIQITVLENAKVIFERVFEQFPVVIGRSPRCDIPFAQFDFISKQHAAIVEVENSPVIIDLESSNGLYFEGKKIRQAPVAEDTVVSIGALTIKFRFQVSEITHSFQDVKKGTPTRPLDQGSQHRIANQATLPAFGSSASKGAPDLGAEPTLMKTQSKPGNNIPQMPSFAGKLPPVPTTPVARVPADPNRIPEKTIITSSKKRTLNDLQLKPKETSQFHSMTACGQQFITPHPMAGNLKPSQRVLEGFVTWKGVLYDLQQFYPGEKVTIGRGAHVGLNLPTLTRKLDLAFFDGTKTQCFIPQGSEVSTFAPRKSTSYDELKATNALAKHAGGFLLKLGDEELASYNLGTDIQVHFRYAPLPKQLKRAKMIEPDEEIKKSTFVSGIVHSLIMLMALLNAPENHGPKIKDVPDRFARLLVEPPRQLIPTPPKPTPPPVQEKVVQKKKTQPEKIVKRKVIQEKPKKVVLTKTPIMKQVNAPRVTKPQGNPVNVNNLGPLAALTALSSNASKSKAPVAININQNAGGPSKFTTSGVMGTLKTAGGKLQAGGIASVQTKGLGVGSGTGYGIQGLKGTAGSRGVAGSVVGSPQLMSIGSSEGLTRAQVMAVVKQHMAQIQQCYERSLFNSPGLAGKVEYEWEITPKGKVNWAKVKTTQMGGADAMNSCVVAVFRKMAFPVAKNGQSTVPSLPLEFGKL